ncbi:MAG: hypothetical protein OES13_11805 [Acidimicrobiia bacterium]|nr:hypothetical protein [Acidimicrobiia bacterium]
MSIFWATQYRPDDTAATIASFGEVSEMFAGIGASQTRLLVAITQDVGTMAVVTNWESLGEAVSAFDPVDGAAYKAIAASPTLSAQLAAAGPPLRRVIGNIDFSLGDTSAGTYAVNVVQSTSAGPDLWAEAAEAAWSALQAGGASGLQVARVLTGDLTGLSIGTVFVDDVNQFTDVLASLPPRLIEIFAATGTTTTMRNIHRVVSS